MNNLQTQLSISLFVLVVFLIGLGAGTVGTNWLNSGPPIGRRFGPVGPVGPVDLVAQAVRIHRSHSLMSDWWSGCRVPSTSLDDQNDRLETLLDSQQENFREMRREMGERFAHARDEFHAALSEILTVEQMQRFESEFVRMGGPPGGARPPRP